MTASATSCHEWTLVTNLFSDMTELLATLMHELPGNSLHESAEWLSVFITLNHTAQGWAIPPSYGSYPGGYRSNKRFMDLSLIYIMNYKAGSCAELMGGLIIHLDYWL